MNFIIDHWGVLTFGGLYLFTAIVAALPEPGDPRPLSQKLYQCFYDSLHILSNRAIEKRRDLQVPKLPAQP